MTVGDCGEEDSVVMVVVSTAESYFTTSTVTAAFTWKLHPIAGKAVEGEVLGAGLDVNLVVTVAEMADA